MELIYTGEELGPDRALELGVANRVAGTDEFKAGLVIPAERIASGSTRALTTSKRSLHRSDDFIEAAIKYKAPAQAVIFKADDHAEGVASFTSRRKPELEGT